MRLRLNLQQKILLLVAGSMSLIVIASSYLHSGRIRSLIEKDHYDNAVSQSVALGNRIAQYDYFSNLEDLQQEMQVVVSSRPDFRQIDVYENQPTVPRLPPQAQTICWLRGTLQPVPRQLRSTRLSAATSSTFSTRLATTANAPPKSSASTAKPSTAWPPASRSSSDNRANRTFHKFIKDRPSAL